MAQLKEYALRFGEQQRLLGILTMPAQHRAELPTIIIPNTGIEHRVGPNRLHVQLARALAAAGFATLRFDLGGLGDSDPSPGRAADSSQDLRDAANMLLARSLGPRFVMIGLCSGAHDVHQFSKNSALVMGALFIDGYTFPTSRFKRRRFFQRLMRLHWKAAEQLPEFFGNANHPMPELLPAFFSEPKQSEVAADFTAMLARGTHLAFLFTGDVESEYNYAEQHFDAFPMLKNRAEVWYQPATDHTLTRRKSREGLIRLIRDWVARLKT
ncbi:MAG: alpha/beta fold hydrolase [Pseudomonadota bacterium]